MDFQEAYPDTSSSVAAAVLSGNIELLKRLIRSGKAVDVKDNRGWQPVHDAAFNGNTSCLKEILKCEIDVDSKTFEEQTALMLACKNGHSKCVSCLLKSGADPNSTTNEDYSPLWEASINGSLECIKLLIDAGADVNCRSFTLDTALHWVIQHRDDSYSLPIVECLVEAGTNLTLQNECGITPVFVAAQFGRKKCLQYLLECANDTGCRFRDELVNKPANDNATSLYLATQNDHVECVQILLQNGANANLGVNIDQNSDPETIYIPLQLALYKNNKECVKLLIPVTNLEIFTWEMNNYDPCAGINYNPVAIAASLDTVDCLKLLLDTQIFSNLYCGENNLNYLAERNVFSFDTKIKPAVFLAKSFRQFIEESLKRNKLALHECISCVMENGLEYFPVFLLMLRLEVNVHFPRYWLDHDSMAYCALQYFCAMLKYTVKGKGIYDTQKFLDENSSVCKIPVEHSDIRKLQCYLTTYFQTVKREDMLQKKMGREFKCFVNQGEINTLQRQCRKTITLLLMLCSSFTKKTVYSLNIPKPIQSFLLYEEDLAFSQSVLKAFESIEVEEENIDKLFADIN